MVGRLRCNILRHSIKMSDTFCGKIKKHVMDHFHKKPLPPKPLHNTTPPTTPTYYGGSTTPISTTLHR
jgi:hypothetical protein